MASSRPLEDALALAALGWPVFPVRLAPKGDKVEKRPLLRAWQRNASPDEGAVRAMDWSEANAVGVALPPGLVAVDVDDPALFEAAGLELPETVGQRTQSGGYHRIYAHDPARTVRQTVKEVPGADTRVGGKGYLVAWERWAFTPGHPGGAPEWLYSERAEQAPTGDDTEPMSTRGQLIAFAGAMRAGGMTGAEVYAILEHRLDTGGIESSNPAWPWTREDLRAIAKEAQKWAAGSPIEPPTVRMVGRQGASGAKARPDDGFEQEEEDAAELNLRHIDPLSWVIEDLVPEGLGLLAAGPKIGKSLLTLQAAIAVALGDDVLGRRTHPRPVLIYSLEDGDLTTQSRLRLLLDGRELPMGQIKLRYNARRLHKGLEEDIDAWLAANPGGLVWIDMLAMVRPAGGGRKSAYDEDYDALRGLKQITRAHRGCTVVLNTHDRKAGSDDWTMRVTGTRGMVGAVDFAMFFDLPRESDEGKLHVQGRNLKPISLAVKREYPAWIELGGRIVEGYTPERQTVYDDLVENGPSTVYDVAERIGKERSNVQHLIGQLIALRRVHSAGMSGKRKLYEAVPNREDDESGSPHTSGPVRPKVNLRPHTSPSSADMETEPSGEPSDLSPSHRSHTSHTSEASVSPGGGGHRAPPGGESAPKRRIIR